VQTVTASALPIAGGTDLLPRRQQGLVAPERLVSLSDIAEITSIAIGSDGAISIGAAVTLAALAETLRERCPIIAEAVSRIASPQIRAMATVGGNLLQDQRCWFYRNDFPCYKRNGLTAPCYAIQGDHRFYHAVIGGHRCQAVTPSDLATVLVALDAQAVLVGPNGTRVIAVRDLYHGPGETVLRAGELLSHVRIDGAQAARRGTFEKLGLWEGDFAIASVALTFLPDRDGRWRDTRVVFGSLAPTPWRATSTERHLDGSLPSTADLRRHLDDELNRSAHPLRNNGWKLDAAAGLAQTACERLLG
jgi:CO/xanthine dehydrogenase FAD-binding subunit